MDPARSPSWQPVDRRQFHLWLEQLPDDGVLGIAAGYTRHPVAEYLNWRDGGLWAVEVRCTQVTLMDREARPYEFHYQDGWLVAFCHELKRPDAYRAVTVADCLQALERVP